MKVAIVIGHTRLRKGAYSPFLYTSEWEFNSIVADKLKDVATIFNHDSYNAGYTSMIKRTARKINRGGFDLVLELHFNAAASRQANGCEALYYFKNSKAKELARIFCVLISSRMGIKNRGVKALYGKHQRGFAAVYYPNPTTLILEPFFGTNRADCLNFNTNGEIEKYATIIKEIITQYEK